MNITKVLLLAGCIVSFVFLGASCSGNVWIKLNRTSYTQGLWKACSNNICFDIRNTGVHDKYDAIRAFSLSAVLATIAASAMALFGLFTDKIKGFIASIFLVVAAICAAIGLGIFISIERTNVFPSYGWSFYLGWVGFGFAVLNSIIGCVAK